MQVLYVCIISFIAVYLNNYYSNLMQIGCDVTNLIIVCMYFFQIRRTAYNYDLRQCEKKNYEVGTSNISKPRGIAHLQLWLLSQLCLKWFIFLFVIKYAHATLIFHFFFSSKRYTFLTSPCPVATIMRRPPTDQIIIFMRSK